MHELAWPGESDALAVTDLRWPCMCCVACSLCAGRTEQRMRLVAGRLWSRPCMHASWSMAVLVWPAEHEINKQSRSRIMHDIISGIV